MSRWAIISGHSHGLGKALAMNYLASGYKVLGLSRSGWVDMPAGLQQVALDLSDGQAVMAWLEQQPFQSIAEQADEIILINNAGVVTPNALAGQQPSLAIAQAVQVNITAPLLLTNAVMAAAQDRVPLRIAHISSGAGRKAYPGWSIYGATKAALDHHAAVIAEEQHNHVRIASIAPGVVNTGMQAKIRASSEEQFPLKDHFIDLYKENRLQTPEQTAQQLVNMIADQNYGLVIQRDVRE